MGSANLAIRAGTIDARVCRTVVLCHIDLEFVRVGPLGWLPSRVVSLLVEIVREVLGVGMADFPVRRQARFSLQIYMVSHRMSSPAPCAKQSTYHDCGRPVTSMICYRHEQPFALCRVVAPIPRSSWWDQRVTETLELKAATMRGNDPYSPQ